MVREALNWAEGGWNGWLLVGWILDRKRAQVFAVECSSCGECVGVMSGGLERWSLGEFWGGFWESFEVCGAGNSEVEGSLCW